ncbi:MAG: feruloyl-CoA synthase [Acidobacteriota bacterium]|nr:feruloyl-CoA synthase [Acidobacteriota bacterium]MDE3170676.1 feruloyl-CoA synthase [Acidobacteriota bacterium]
MSTQRAPSQLSENTPVRPVRLRTSGATMERRADGSFLIRPDEPLEPYPRVLTERLIHWAGVAPERALAAKRGRDGRWRYLTYGEALRKVRSLGQALLDRKLSAQRPVAILSDNDLEHLLLMFAGQHVGVPTASIAPPYSLISKDFAKLRHVMKTLEPGLMFVSNGEDYRRALDAAVNREIEVVYAEGELTDRRAIAFDELASAIPTVAVDTAHAAIQPDDIAKFLFSSGSTGLPKAVINTHRMLCSNQQMILQGFRFLEDEPPVLLDWMPWNHTAGGNHNTGLPLYNGGTLYIDDGRPTATGIAATVENLRDVAPTLYFNMPRGYEELLVHFRRDKQLREKFFSRVKFMFYAGAGLSQALWDAYRELMLETCGERVLIATGLGATETSPMALQCTWDTEHAGSIGIPMPGVETKLAPVGSKLEVRVKGPNVTPGYWKEPELTARAFDEEGYYRFGDAARFIDPNDINQGLFFDGRLAEDFKLASGTFVNIGPLRARILTWFAPHVTDVAIAGPDRRDLGILIFPNPQACRALAPDLPASATPNEILRHPAVVAQFTRLLDSFAEQATGNSNRVVRAMLMDEPPSLDAGEITDKGSLNQKVILDRRARLVEEMYSPETSPRVLRVQSHCDD